MKIGNTYLALTTSDVKLKSTHFPVVVLNSSGTGQKINSYVDQEIVPRRHTKTTHLARLTASASILKPNPLPHCAHQSITLTLKMA